jgi:hypothetical protein
MRKGRFPEEQRRIAALLKGPSARPLYRTDDKQHVGCMDPRSRASPRCVRPPTGASGGCADFLKTRLRRRTPIRFERESLLHSRSTRSVAAEVC